MKLVRESTISIQQRDLNFTILRNFVSVMGKTEILLQVWSVYLIECHACDATVRNNEYFCQLNDVFNARNKKKY
jgi:hypothetical protein